jgi:hypothetical protein
MTTPTYEEVRRDPELLNTILQAARCERSQAVHHLIAAAFRGIFSRPRRLASRSSLQTSPCG